MLTGPLGLTAFGEPASSRPAGEQSPFSVIPQGASTNPHGVLWGAPVVPSTQCPAGTAIVASIKAGGGMFWQRLGMLLQFDPYAGPSGTNFVTNTMTWRVEIRCAMSVPRSTALCSVTGLPTS
jgi:hypothetical protein